MDIRTPEYPEVSNLIVVVPLCRNQTRVTLRTIMTGSDGALEQRDFCVFVDVTPPASADTQAQPDPETEEKLDYRELYEEYGGGGD